MILRSLTYFDELPVEKSGPDFTKRTELFQTMDKNEKKNGLLTLEEVLTEVKAQATIDEKFDMDGVVKAAFDMAKVKVKNRQNQADDFVNRFEFRLMLVFLKRYFEILKIFVEFDKGVDGKMSVEEFRNFMEKVDASENADELFLQLDKDQSGELSISEVEVHICAKLLESEEDAE